MLVGDVLGLSRAQLRTRGHESVSWGERYGIMCNVRKRAAGMPLAYVRGWQGWGGMKLHVSPAVLIPRDETEYLLEMMVARENPKSILDVGTGSGCLALGLAKAFPEAEVMALDYSLSALKVARRNFKSFGVNIDSIHSDLLSSVSDGAQIDLIVANLPYVPTDIVITKEVAQEPQDAIFSGEDGLVLLRRFAQELEGKNIEFKSLWLEFLPKQWPEIEVIFDHWSVEPVRDLGGEIYFARVSSE